ncbi:MAG: electron transfer flavoprotein subunit beta/FixA family protein [Desulfobacterales bacterium]|nr:electron transfer flavoprotein subunit beta/FixA family protein [Desulfobacterales bacterium]
MKLVVCIKQVPMVSELPWDSKTRTLKRHLAEGMMNPACRHALEAALQLKRNDTEITVLTMGPPMAEEILREAIALGADRGLLMTDPRLAGADTFATSRALALAIRKYCQDFDLVLCGCQTSDSETAQVGPQLAEELDVPGVAYIEALSIDRSLLTVRRVCDNFLEELEMDLPALVTVSTRQFYPRYVHMAGIEDAFNRADIFKITADDLGLSPEQTGINSSPTRILTVFSPTAEKKNILLKGTPKKIVDQFLDAFDDKITSAIGKDLITRDHLSALKDAESGAGNSEG